ncbi:hypothetical protein AB0K80_29785 [Streptomyces sp. NPDC052682]|uniref:hypothetical protein n=1 Tax=Streptomyces sp. NPDC052682 TaxID=3154954 RepID=UPI003437B807
MSAGWGSRALRAAVFAAVCVLLAALGHVMMSGSHVGALTLAAAAAGTGLAGWCLAGRERGGASIVSAVVGLQTALHSLFAHAPGHAGTSPGPDAVHHTMDAAHRGMAPMGAMEHTGHAMNGGTWSSGMLAAHLLAALLCGLWLAHGERAAFRILRAVAGWLAAPLRLPLALPAPPHRPRIRPRRRRDDRSPRRLLLVHVLTSRGPPRGSAVA